MRRELVAFFVSARYAWGMKRRIFTLAFSLSLFLAVAASVGDGIALKKDGSGAEGGHEVGGAGEQRSNKLWRSLPTVVCGGLSFAGAMV